MLKRGLFIVLFFFPLVAFASDLLHLALITSHETLLKEFAQQNGIVTHPPTKPKKHRKLTVIIDPGHGGRDAGAIGPNGAQEKVVVLAIARKVASLINKTPGMRAMLTRNDDHYLSLRQRLKLARKEDADIFIAIHADAYFNPQARGSSVFALSQRAATSEAARWLVQKNNYTELDDVELNALQDRSPMLRSVLIDLAQTATIQDSLKLGTQVLHALNHVSSLHYPQVEQAPFLVLRSPDIPSILIETGFISHPKEAARLSDPAYQQQLAHAISQGVRRYLKP